jgi:hypothetical protein
MKPFTSWSSASSRNVGTNASRSPATFSGSIFPKSSGRSGSPLPRQDLGHRDLDPRQIAAAPGAMKAGSFRPNGFSE